MEATQLIFIGGAMSASFVIALLGGSRTVAVLLPAGLAALPLAVMVLLEGALGWAFGLFFMVFLWAVMVCAVGEWLGRQLVGFITVLRRTPEERALLAATRAPGRSFLQFFRDLGYVSLNLLLGIVIVAALIYLTLSLAVLTFILAGVISAGDYLGLEFKLTNWPTLLTVQAICAVILAICIPLSARVRRKLGEG